MSVTTAAGRTVALQRLLKGQVTALQLMFTGCTATCPIQGAIFADAARMLAGASNELRLLSVSIDPLGDSPKALADWLGRFGTPPSQRWTAAVPRVQDVDTLFDFLRGRASGVDRHTAQAFLFDRQARLAFRTVDMPAGADLAALMRQLAEMP
jgi:protein SCO1/2